MDMMRKSVIAAILMTSSLLGAVAYAQNDPRERFNRGRGQITQPAQRAGASGPIQDQGVHNAVHAAHQNSIVFTRSDLGIGAISDAAIVSDFTLGQPMFFRIFTERSAVNAIAAANNLPARAVYADGVHYTARFTIDGQVFDTAIFPWGGRRDHETWTTWRGQFVNSTNAQRTPGSDAFLEMLSRATAAGLLKPGRHAVRMEVIPQTNTENSGPIRAGVVASGMFTLTVPAGIFQPGNRHVCGPVRGAAGSPALEARALAQARQYWDWAELTPAKAIGNGEDWDVTRNELTSIPIERSTKVAIIARGAKYCTSHTHEFTEKYMGGGRFSTSTGGISVNFTPGYVPCACLS